jgi:S1-C subfamily serine protease
VIARILLLILLLPSVAFGGGNPQERGAVALVLRSSVVLTMAGNAFCGGSLVGDDLVLTASHCLARRSGAGQVLFSDGAQSDYTVYKDSRPRDLALLKLPAARGRPAKVDTDVVPGDTVWVVGAPAGGAFYLRRGIIAAVRVGQFTNSADQGDIGTARQQYLVLEPLVFYGSSGGGVFDWHGNLVGVVVRLGLATEPGQAPFILWGYAVGPQAIREFLDEP